MIRHGFAIRRGTNISGAFIDPHLTEIGRDRCFSNSDIKAIVRFGFDHIRLPISEEIMWDRDGAPILQRFKRLETAIAQSIESGLKVILCLHALRSHPIFGKGVPTLFTQPAEQQRFVRIWRELSERFSALPADCLAYEFLNEPRAPTDAEWNLVLAGAYRALRAMEPNRMLLFGSNFYQIPERIKSLELPADDPNIMRTFHLYYPMLFTHYKASWIASGSYHGPVQYPGRPIPNEHVDSLPERLGSHMGQNNAPVTRHVFMKVLRDAAKSLNDSVHPIHCGEFGCIDTVPIDARRRWYADVVSCLDEDNIPWTHWDWKGNFGVLDKSSWKPSSIHRPLGLKNPLRGGVALPGRSLSSKLRRRLGRIARALGLRRPLPRP